MHCQIINFSTDQLHVVAEYNVGMFSREFSTISEAYHLLTYLETR